MSSTPPEYKPASLEDWQKAAAKSAAKSAARNTDSGPARIAPAAAGDLAARKMSEVQQMSAAMDNTDTKAAEHGFANGLKPLPGATGVNTIG